MIRKKIKECIDCGILIDSRAIRCCKCANSGKNSPHWRGGRRITNFGYVLIHNPKHPCCTNQGYVLEHRLLMEKHLGRYLKSTEIIHHINGMKDDNRPENLQIFTEKEHGKKHRPKKKPIICQNCKQYKKYHAKNMCKKCYSKDYHQKKTRKLIFI